MVVALIAVMLGGCARRQAGEGPENKGRGLFTQFGCNSCHTVDGTPGVGPSLKGVYESSVRLNNGETVNADEAYLRESITDPDAKIVSGFTPGIMPAAVPKAQVSKEENLAALVAYIKTLK